MRLVHFLLAASLWALPAAGAEQVAEQPGTIAVWATGSVEVAPDLLRISLTVTETAKRLAEANVAADQVTRRIAAIAKQHGIADRDLDNARLSSWPEASQWFRDRVTVRRTTTLTIRQLQRYNSLMAALSELPLEIGAPQPSHSALEELQAEALKQALAKGRQKAALIAQAMGLTLGPAVSIVEQETHYSPAPRYARHEAAATGAPSFSFGVRQAVARVHMKFAILKGE